MAYQTFMILENGLPMDGEFYSFDRLMKAIRYADYDAQIVAFDAAELGRDLATSLRDVTEEMTVTWWTANGGQNETLAMIEAGRGAPELALKYYPETCALHSDLVEAA